MPRAPPAPAGARPSPTRAPASRPGGPGGDELVVEHLRRADDGDPLAVDRAAERAIRLLCVQADADDREAMTASRSERVAKAHRAVVEPVVVGHRRNVDSTAAQRGERARGVLETRTPSAVGDAAVVTAVSRFTTDRSARRNTGLDRKRARRRARLPAPLRERPFEVHVSAEREHDRRTVRAGCSGLQRLARRVSPPRRAPRLRPHVSAERTTAKSSLRPGTRSTIAAHCRRSPRVGAGPTLATGAMCYLKVLLLRDRAGEQIAGHEHVRVGVVVETAAFVYVVGVASSWPLSSRTWMSRSVWTASGQTGAPPSNLPCSTV